MSSLQKLMAAAMAFAGLLLLSAPNALAADPTVTVKVIDSAGKPVAGVFVHLYRGVVFSGKSQCLNGNCFIAPDGSTATDKRGIAKFSQGLIRNSAYIFAINDFASGGCPSACFWFSQAGDDHTGNDPSAATVFTDKNGSHYAVTLLFLP